MEVVDVSTYSDRLPNRLLALAEKIVVYPSEYEGFLNTASQLFYVIGQYKELITTYDNMYKYYIETAKKKLDEKIKSVSETYYNCAEKFDNLEKAYKSYEPSSTQNKLTTSIQEIVNLYIKIKRIRNNELFKLHAANFFIFSGSLLLTVYHFYKKDGVDITKLQERIENFTKYVKDINFILKMQKEETSRRVNKKKKTVRKSKGLFYHLGKIFGQTFGTGAYTPPKSETKTRTTMPSTFDRLQGRR